MRRCCVCAPQLLSSNHQPSPGGWVSRPALLSTKGGVLTAPPCRADVVEIEKTDEHFRLIYDPKGRFVVHRITAEEAAYKLCRVKEVKRSAKNVPVAITHDGRTIRYPDPLVKRDDTVMVDIETGKIKDFVKFETGNMIMVCGGRNRGRVGILVHQEKHKGSHTICHVKDSAGNQFATRSTNIFTIGKGNKPLISLPKGKGIKLTILQEQAKAYKTAA